MPYRSQTITPKMAREGLARAQKHLARTEARAAATWEALRVIEARLVREELKTESEVAAAESRHAVAVEWERSLSRTSRPSAPPIDPGQEKRRLARLRKKQETSEVRTARRRAEAADAERRKAAEEVAAAQMTLDTALALERAE